MSTDHQLEAWLAQEREVLASPEQLSGKTGLEIMQAMLDSALGCSVHTLMPAGRSCATAELKARSSTVAANWPPPRRVWSGLMAPCTRTRPPPAWCSTF